MPPSKYAREAADRAVKDNERQEEEAKRRMTEETAAAEARRSADEADAKRLAEEAAAFEQAAAGADPSDWAAYLDENGVRYFHCATTGESSWHPPASLLFHTCVRLQRWIRTARESTREFDSAIVCHDASQCGDVDKAPSKIWTAHLCEENRAPYWYNHRGPLDLV